MRSFEYHVKGIETAMIAALQAATGTYAGTVTPYRGELDAEELSRESRNTLSRLISNLPLFMVCYVHSSVRNEPNLPQLLGRPHTFRHDCTFSVIACASDARGERTGQTTATQGIGVYRMIGDAMAAISGKHFTVTETVGATTETVLLNIDPMTLSLKLPKNPEYIVRMEELTAYAIHFDTFFEFETLDRGMPGIEVEDIIFNIDVLNRTRLPATREPGVHFDVATP